MDLKQRAKQNTGTTNVRQGFELDQVKLEAWMGEHVDGFAPPIVQIEQFKGGQSNPTYKVSTQSSAYVLRSKPRGKLLKSAHAVDREYRVMLALGQTAVPVPKMFGLCASKEVIGAEFYIMAFTDGLVFWDLPTDNWTVEQRAKVWQAGAQAAMALHSVDVEHVGLSNFGKQGGYVARQLKRWSEQYAYTRDGVDNPCLEKLIAWLPERLPQQEPTSIVHGDLQLSNMILAPDLSACTALIDWELSTLGNPISDFAYFCRDYYMPARDGGFGADAARLGLPDIEALKVAYTQTTGFKIGDDWMFYVIFNMFRLAAIRQGVAKRIKDGTATSANAETATKGAVLMAETAWNLAQSVP